MSIGKLAMSWESPQSSDPTPNSAIESRYTGLRPLRSANLPMTGMDAA